MIKTLYPIRDTTLYQASESANTSKDEILEISKHVSSSFGPLAVTRPILQFNTTPLSASLSAQGINTLTTSGSLRYFLKLFISKEEDIQRDYSLVVHPLRQPWEGGTGRSTSIPIVTDGCSWKYTDSETTGTVWTPAGGRIFESAALSSIQTFTDVQGDIEVDITATVESWNTGANDNYGLLIKRSGSQETDSSIQGSLYYYSSNTNTIYSPRIEARYDDASHAFTDISGSTITISDEIDIQPRLRPEYKQNSQERIAIITTQKNGARTQAGSVGSTFRSSLPQSSSYAIIDNATGEYVYKHDQHATYIARTGASEHCIDIDMNGLFPERYYAIEFKVNHYSGTSVIATRYYKSNTVFKVVR